MNSTKAPFAAALLFACAISAAASPGLSSILGGARPATAWIVPALGFSALLTGTLAFFLIRAVNRVVTLAVTELDGRQPAAGPAILPVSLHEADFQRNLLALNSAIQGAAKLPAPAVRAEEEVQAAQ